MTIHSSEYWTEVKALADGIIEDAIEQTDNLDDAEELINDSMLHETIDGHQWISYYSYNLDIIRHSDNEDYYIDNIGDFASFDSLLSLHQAVAFYALYADVSEQIYPKLEELKAA